MSLAAVMAFVLGFASGSGPIPWVYLPEVNRCPPAVPTCGSNCSWNAFIPLHAAQQVGFKVNCMHMPKLWHAITPCAPDIALHALLATLIYALGFVSGSG